MLVNMIFGVQSTLFLSVVKIRIRNNIPHQKPQVCAVREHLPHVQQPACAVGDHLPHHEPPVSAVGYHLLLESKKEQVKTT